MVIPLSKNSATENGKIPCLASAFVPGSGAANFQPLVAAEMQRLPDQYRVAAADGHLELFKTTTKYDGKVGREQHHSQPCNDSRFNVNCGDRLSRDRACCQRNYRSGSRATSKLVIIQSFLSFAANSSAFGIAAPKAVLSKIHHTRVLSPKLAACATIVFRESLE